MIKTKRPPGSNRIAETSSTDPLQLFHFDNQGAACSGLGDYRPLKWRKQNRTPILSAWSAPAR
jgi:hypothetical protein